MLVNSPERKTGKSGGKPRLLEASRRHRHRLIETAASTRDGGGHTPTLARPGDMWNDDVTLRAADDVVALCDVIKSTSGRQW